MAQHSSQSHLSFYQLLESSLTEKLFCKEMGMTKSAMKELLQTFGLPSICHDIDASKDFTCAHIHEKCESILDHFAGKPQEGWLTHSFSQMLNILFPGRCDGLDPIYTKGVFFFYRILRAAFQHEKSQREFSPFLDMARATEEEIKTSFVKDEYAHLIKALDHEYVYEFYRLASEITPFNNLGHVSGVHHVAVHVARQLQQLGVQVDLPLVSASALTHDIGKFGCKEHEARRIPYLHYYYTDEWLKRHKMPQIAHIASNHSTWDLELENLSVESLILIYSDFRVKSTRNSQGEEVIRFYDLKQSYDVILSKLDNVDDTKRHRYQRVYQKLYDFEMYMKGLGVSTNIHYAEPEKMVHRDPALLTGAEAVERLKHLAIEHNIGMMYRLRNQAAFGTILEDARSEKLWKNIGAYVNTIGEYYTYMNQGQKEMAIQFLYDLLIHREGGIRRQAATLIGAIIANFNEEYRKELPEGARRSSHEKTNLQLWEIHLAKVLCPDLKFTEQQRRWMGYTLKFTLESVLENCRDDEKNGYVTALVPHLSEKDFYPESRFILLDTLFALPFDKCSHKMVEVFFEYAVQLCENESEPIELEVKVACFRLIRDILFLCRKISSYPETKKRMHRITMMEYANEGFAGVLYLKMRIRQLVGLTDKITKKYDKLLFSEYGITSHVFRDNLKVDTLWVIKVVNIEFLMDQLNALPREKVFYVATHLANLLKVSERVSVRHIAGEALVEVCKLLDFDQRNEIGVELTKGLAIGEYQFSKYIPQYLGEIVSSLPPEELGEILLTLSRLMENRNEKVASVALDTLGYILEHIDVHKNFLDRNFQAFREKQSQILGVILRGMANYHPLISQEAFMVLGQHIFGSKALALDDKFFIFKAIYKKMLTLFVYRIEDQLTFFNNAATLNHIYRFISDYIFYKGKIELPDNEKVAFFPGTFDPFSKGHKGIVETIRNLGYDVYLALDEFSWSKKTQPRMVRQKIVNMSVADQKNVYIFPSNEPINIANPEDLEKLSRLLPGSIPYIVVGSDVIANASSYKLPPKPYSIHQFPHIVFKRESKEQGKDPTARKYREMVKGIKADIVELSLPIHLEDISSTQIRENIDQNREISTLIDPVVQNYIYDFNLYMRESQYKDKIASDSFRCRVSVNEQGTHEFCVEKGGKSAKRIGCVQTKTADTANLYNEFKNDEVTAYIRRESLGKVLILSGIQWQTRKHTLGQMQMLLTEILAQALKEDYTYAVYNPEPEETLHPDVVKLLSSYGFHEIRIEGASTGIFAVTMKNPITLFRNMSTVLKYPFNSNSRVDRVLEKTHGKLQFSLRDLYPDSLILSFNSEMMHQKLMEKITALNGVDQKPDKLRRLGPNMCVPFGKILNNVVVPNTVTKTLHTDKTFSPDLKSFAIGQYPFYASIDDQVRTIKSFNRPVLLVDDLLHKGYRMKRLDPLFKEQNVHVEKLIVGLLSGRGKDLMTAQGREVDSVYFVPNLKAWFVESSLYPFIGGDGLKREDQVLEDTVMSVNLILPYVMPRFMANEQQLGIYNFSMACLENTLDIFEILEEEYQKAYKKKLTLQRLPEVFLSPRMPDLGRFLSYDRNMAPSDYIKNDMERLSRVAAMVL